MSDDEDGILRVSPRTQAIQDLGNRKSSQVHARDRSSMMTTTIEVKGVAIETDDQGFLMDPEAWDDEVAVQLAQKEGLKLSDEHRKILKFIRNYFNEHRVAADARFVIKYLAEDLGYNKNARHRLYELFPYGYMQQVCKIAGMRRPRAWSTG